MPKYEVPRYVGKNISRNKPEISLAHEMKSAVAAGLSTHSHLLILMDDDTRTSRSTD